MESLWRDICFAFRVLTRRPAVSALAALSLALGGVGANTMIFSIVNARFLSGVPVRDPESLVALFVSPSDPVVFGVMALTLGSVGAMATLFPALRATSVDPLIALRYE